eukprot:5986413-Amphidinium_carterae.1
MLKAVPGFLGVSDFWRWVIGNAVALVSGLVTGFGLEFLAGVFFGPSVDRATLQLMSVMLASTLLPGLLGHVRQYGNFVGNSNGSKYRCEQAL